MRRIGFLAVLIGVATASVGSTNAATRAEGSWPTVAAQLSMVVLKPTKTFGLRLAFVRRIVGDPGCDNADREMLRGLYAANTGPAYFEVLEGRPRYCTDNPIELPVARSLRIRGVTARLYRLGQPRSYLLEWCDRGTVVTLRGTAVSSARLIAIARGMRPVDGAPARRCLFSP